MKNWLAIIRINSLISKNPKEKSAARVLKLNRVNSAIFLFTDISENILAVTKRLATTCTWGYVPSTLLRRLVDLKVRAGCSREINCTAETCTQTPRLNLRLHPPITGYRSTKKQYSDGGALGFRDEMPLLIQKFCRHYAAAIDSQNDKS